MEAMQRGTAHNPSIYPVDYRPLPAQELHWEFTPAAKRCMLRFQQSLDIDEAYLLALTATYDAPRHQVHVSAIQHETARQMWHAGSGGLWQALGLNCKCVCYEGLHWHPGMASLETQPTTRQARLCYFDILTDVLCAVACNIAAS
jgi:hypothetical protein